MGVGIESLVGELEEYLNRQQYEYDSNDDSSVRTGKRVKKRQTALNFFGSDLTEKARNGELDPVVGREQQIKRMVTILGRRTKEQPCPYW